MTKTEWWRGASIYQIYPRSFQDSSGNGIGDLTGITSRLDYVARLGVDAIWISPFFTSPMKDFGYDVADYRGVDPLFGTLDDFLSLLGRAHELGLKVMIDQVWSHTSDQHVWFKESRQNNSNPKADWYTWADAKPDGTPPNNWQSVFGGPAWSWDTRREQYYLHNFLTEQPDLNFHNLDVQDAILDVARFWLGLGVDGFRLDVCNLFFQDKMLRDNPVRQDRARTPNPHDWQAHKYCRSQPENLQFLSRLRALTDEYEDVCLMGEVFDDNGLVRVMEYTRGSDRLHTAYCFDLLAPQNDAPFLHSVLHQWTNGGGGWPTWALGNHDVPRVATRWTDGVPTTNKLELFAAFQMSLGGSLCIYQGEELGLEQASIPFDKLQDPEGIAFWPEKPGRDGCRTPMPWTPAAQFAGFTRASEPWLPMPYAHQGKEAESQVDVDGSVFEIYRNLLAFRSANPTLLAGQMSMLDSDENVVGFTRSLGDEKLVCLFNFSSHHAGYSIEAGSIANLILGHASKIEGNQISHGPWGWAIISTSA